MTVSVLIALCTQAVALFLMHRFSRGQWLRNPGALLLLVAAIYHGGTEIVQTVWPGRNHYRLYVSQAAIDNWLLLVSAALLTYTLGYGFQRRSERDVEPSTDSLRGLSLRILVVLTVPLVWLTIQGRGAIATLAGDATRASTSDNYLSSGLALQFLSFTVAVSCVLLLAKYGPRWTLPVLLMMATLLALAGGRALIVATTVLVVLGVASIGVRLPRRSLIAAGAIVVLLGMVISAGRPLGTRGLFAENRGVGDRVSALMEGGAALGTSRGREAVLDDFVYRFDGNTFGAMLLERLDRAEPVYAETTVNNLRLAVPSFLMPSKLEAPKDERDEEFFLIKRYGMAEVDYLPGYFAVLMTYLNAVGLPLLAALMGLVFARLDGWVRRSRSPARFLLGMGLANCALYYEQGLQIFPLSLRGVLLVVGVVAVTGWLARQRTSLRSSSDPVLRDPVLGGRRQVVQTH